jgi:tRNA modification GTPase
LDEEPIGRVLFGHWNVSAGEEVVVCRASRFQVEVHCHGGRVAAGEIMQSLLDLGCEQRTGQQWLHLQEPDPIAAAARGALARATTERTAAILLDQYHGALRRGLNELLASLDRADRAAVSLLETLRARSSLGLHLTTPWKVALLGRPNVGKSSLINALLGYERAIVMAEPGTTRDVLSAGTALAGWPVELFDTAGQRTTADPLEAAGIELASEMLKGADLLLLIADASQGWTDADALLASRWPRALVVWNKCDLVDGRRAEHPATARMPPVSALMRQGIDELAAEIGRRLVPLPPPPESAVPFTVEIVGELEEATAFVGRGQFDEAARHLRDRNRVQPNFA